MKALISYREINQLSKDESRRRYERGITTGIRAFVVQFTNHISFVVSVIQRAANMMSFQAELCT